MSTYFDFQKRNESANHRCTILRSLILGYWTLSNVVVVVVVVVVVIIIIVSSDSSVLETNECQLFQLHLHSLISRKR